MMERTVPDFSENNAYYNPEATNQKWKPAIASKTNQITGSYNTIQEDLNQPGVISVFD